MRPQRVLRLCVVLAAVVVLGIVAAGAEHAIEVGYDYQQAQQQTPTTAPILAEQLRGYFAAKIPAGSRVYVAGEPADSTNLWAQRIAEGLVLAGLMPVRSAAQAQYQVVVTDKDGQPGVLVEALR